MIRRLHLITGLILFGYLLTHLINHALGLISLDALEAGRRVFLLLWRNLPMSVLLYGAIAIHMALAYRALYRRRRLAMPAWEAAQIVLGLAIGVRISANGSTRIPGARRVRDWLERFPLREIRPFFLGFLALTIFDVVIQGLASRAFGLDIAWTALAARIPLLYLALVIPSLGNFGTRELAWAGLFSEFGSRDALIAYAFAVNSVFLILNVLIGTLFLKRALELVGEVRRAREAGEPAPAPLLRDPTDG